MNPMDRPLAPMIAAAQTAGDLLMERFANRERLHVRQKGVANFVCDADLAAESAIVARLQDDFPLARFEAEERGGFGSTRSDYTWLIDPLDGTTNFLNGIPHFGVCIALVREGDVVASVIHCPASAETFSAERGRGASLNGSPLATLGHLRAQDAVVSVGLPYAEHGPHDRVVEGLQRFEPLVAGVRCNGAASLDLAWIAACRLDGYIEWDLQPWDIAAGELLVREAGGVVTGIDGTSPAYKTGTVCAGHPDIYPLIRDSFAPCAGPALPIIV